MLTLRGFANKEISNHALDGKSLPKKIKLLSWGKNETTDGDVYLDEKTIAMFNSMQEKMGRDEDVALDFDHNTVPGSIEYKQGQPKNIAAYGQPELIEGDGLYLTDLEWTPLGKSKALDYKDLSPACWTDKDGSVTGLHSAALTPNGAVHGLKFYSAKTVGEFEDMIKKMTSDKIEKIGFTTDLNANDSYNKDGANAGVKKVGDDYKAVTNLDADDMGTETFNVNDKHDENDEDCSCMDCMSLDYHSAKYGDVDYADKENNKYPINTEKHVRAAWSYINMPKNASKYDSNKLSIIKGHIKTAAKSFGINIAENDNKNKTKTMSANLFPKPDAYRAEEWYNNTMNDSIIKKMAAEVGMDGESDAAKVLFAFLAKYEGLQTELTDLINKKDNSDEGGLKQFSAKFSQMENEIKTLKADKASNEREFILKQAAKEGKVIALSANKQQTIDIDTLKDIIANTSVNVPMNLQLKSMSVKTVKTQEDAKNDLINSFNRQVAESKALPAFVN